jgi:hypothetical protein
MAAPAGEARSYEEQTMVAAKEAVLAEVLVMMRLTQDRRLC